MTTEKTAPAPTEQPKPVTPATAPPTSEEATDILAQLAGVGVQPGENDKATLEEHLIPAGPPTEVIQQASAGEVSGGLEKSIVTGAQTVGLQTDFTAPMVATTHSEDGRIYIYNRYTGEQVPCNVNMLASKLKNRVNDNVDPNYGKLLWTVVDPGFRPKQGTYKCWLHKEGAWRELADGWNRPLCLKSNIQSSFFVIQHMKKRHTTDYAAITEHKAETERQETRKSQRLMAEAMTAIAANREADTPVEMPVEEPDQPADVAFNDGYDKALVDNGLVTTEPEKSEQPDIWKNAHKSKERPRGCPMDDCDWTTRSKSNKVARSTIGRHRKEKHPETLNA